MLDSKLMRMLNLKEGIERALAWTVELDRPDVGAHLQAALRTIDARIESIKRND